MRIERDEIIKKCYVELAELIDKDFNKLPPHKQLKFVEEFSYVEEGHDDLEVVPEENLSRAISFLKTNISLAEFRGK